MQAETRQPRGNPAPPRRRPGTPAVIVDAGSAVTVDYLDESGAFPGGVLFPVPRLVAQSLPDYTAPPPVRGGRPTHLRFKRRGGNAVLTWHPAANARFYVVVVKGSDGRVTQFLVRAHSPRRVTVLRTLPFEGFTATVRAEGGPDSLAGPAAKARLGKKKVTHTALNHSAAKRGQLPGRLLP